MDNPDSADPLTVKMRIIIRSMLTPLSTFYCNFIAYFAFAMKHKLVTFSDFANQLYPHEVDYLMSINKFAKEINREILQIIHFNCHNPEKAVPFDTEVDKRTYSYIKNWIVESLEKADVDKFYEWLLRTEKQVMMDAISAEEERQVTAFFKTITPSHYYFLRFYELVEHFRDYLLIRVRNLLYKPTNDYLKQYEKDYLLGQSVNKQLNNAAVEIIRQHENPDADPSSFIDFLNATFFDTSLDGYTRYRAAVRLTFLYYNYRDFEQLRVVYNALDEEFKGDSFYSKRLLANFYSNRAMMHSKLNELGRAEHYGTLSIRQKNSDFLFYIANLCGVLLRSKKYEKAHKLMSQNIPELKNASSFYNKIGFVSFYIRTLVYNNKAKSAVSYGTTFLEAYRKEIFQTRWHLFFGAYLQALLNAEKYSRVIAVAKRYNLISLENKFVGTSVYTPVLLWYYELALYIEGKQSKEMMVESIVTSARKLLTNTYKNNKVIELLENLSHFIPSEIEEVKQALKSS